MYEMVKIKTLTGKYEMVDVNKIIAYEDASGPWLYHVMMLADNPELDGNFTLDSDDLATLIPPNYYVEKIYLEEHPIEEARQMVLDGINEGAVLMNYFGHSGLDRLAQEGLLTTNDVNSLNNGEKLPITTAMSCVVGRFEIPGYNCLSEAMVLKSDGGAIATWAPTGLCFNADSKILAEYFYSDFLVGGEESLGDVVLKALEAYKNSDRDPNVLYLYNLLGDPVLLVR